MGMAGKCLSLTCAIPVSGMDQLTKCSICYCRPWDNLGGIAYEIDNQTLWLSLLNPQNNLLRFSGKEQNQLETNSSDTSLDVDAKYDGYKVLSMVMDLTTAHERVLRLIRILTVTIEDHPHMSGKHASIHPCRHGAVMKKIIDVLMSNGGEPEVDK
eukprot:Gb_27676 [translate_table: standard]